MKPERRFLDVESGGIEVETREDGSHVIKGIAAVAFVCVIHQLESLAN